MRSIFFNIGTSSVLQIFGSKTIRAFLLSPKKTMSAELQRPLRKMVVKVGLGRRRNIIQIYYEEYHHFTRNQCAERWLLIAGTPWMSINRVSQRVFLEWTTRQTASMKMTMNYWTKFLFLVSACISTSILLITSKHTRGPKDIIFTVAGSRKQRLGVLLLTNTRKHSQYPESCLRNKWISIDIL